MIFLNFLSQFLALSSSILSKPQEPCPSDYIDHCTIAEQIHWTSILSHAGVALPQKNPTKSFWTHGSDDANPLAKEGSDGPLATDADIVIIGSGITGVGTAYHLSKVIATTDLSLNIVIFEARDFCSGATGRNGGHLTPNVFKGFQSVAEKYDTAEALREIVLENHTASSLLSILNPSGNEVDLVHGGHIDFFSSDNEEAASRADWLAAKKAGADVEHVEFFSKEETHRMYGLAFPSVRFSGHNLWPLKAVTHLFRLAQQNIAKSNKGLQLRLHTQTPVTSITALEPSLKKSTQLPRQWLIDTPRGTVRTHAVIHATNGYAAHLLPFLAAHTKGVSIIPTRGQVIATRSSVSAQRLLTPSISGKDEYWFPRPVSLTEAGGTRPPLVVLGGGRGVGGPGYEHGVTDDSVVNPIVSKVLRDFLPSVYPEGWFQKGKEPEMEWTGIMGYTDSGHPLVGVVYDSVNTAVLDGQYIAAGYNGHGMPRAFGCAEALVQFIISDIKNETWKIPDWLPHHFLTTSDLNHDHSTV